MIDGVSGASSQLQVSLQSPKPSASSTASTSEPVQTGGALPGQSGAGIGDLQSVAPSAVGRGQIIDIAA